MALSAVLCEAGTGGYKIYYEEELLEALPESVRNRETLEAALKNLSDGKYIDVKYARGNAFCVAAFKKFEVKTEAVKEETVEVVPCAPPFTFNAKRFYIISALSAFCGGAVSGCIAAVLGAVL